MIKNDIEKIIQMIKTDGEIILEEYSGPQFADDVPRLREALKYFSEDIIIRLHKLQGNKSCKQ